MQKKRMKFYALRKQKNLSQGDLAKEVGVSQNSIVKYEHGECLPRVTTFVRLHQVLNVSMEELAIALELLPEKQDRTQDR